MIPLALAELGLLLGLCGAFAFSIGAHYTGACMGMPTAAGAIRQERALLLMAPLSLLGALVASSRVETTVGVGLLAGGTLDLGAAAIIVLVALALTTVYNFVALPTSTIQIFVFTVLGVGLALGRTVEVGTVVLLLATWALAPFAAMGLGFGLVRVLDRWRTARRVGPGGLGPWAGALVLVGAGASFAMGANDVSNASGPLVMSGALGLEAAAFVGGVGLAAGVLLWGKPLLQRVAFDIVDLDPAMATSAQLSQAGVILVAVAFGQFTSMNQALVGGMVGAGLARGRHRVAWSTIRGILLGWAAGPLSGAGAGFVAGLVALHLGL